jgi:branched-chain amino acid transport system substrate-binding protein
VKTRKQTIITRRTAIKALGAGTVLATGAWPRLGGYAQAQSSEPIKIGFQVHRTGIGAA